MVSTILPSATPKTGSAAHHEAWRTIVPLLAGRPRVRISRDGGRNYRQRDERDLSELLPSRPAAVMLYDGRTGLSRILAIDFDSKTFGTDKVQLDVRRVQNLLSEHNIRWIHDRSASGGEHLYVPVAGGLSLGESVDVLELLSQLCPTIDPSPHRSIQHGCIRMPGSAHKQGGHQELLMSSMMALTVASRPTPRTSFTSLHQSLEKYRPAKPTAGETPEVFDREGAGPMNAVLLDIARNGFRPSSRYDSPSEARFAVLRSASNLGMRATEIYQRMNDGRWPGLSSLFSRYKSPMKELKADLLRLKSKGHRNGNATVVKSNTSRPKAQGGSETLHSASFYQGLKIWRNAFHLKEATYGSNKAGLQIRLLLRALGEAASKAQSTLIEFGCRSLAIATGLDHSTVSRHLRTLRSEKEPLIQLVCSAQGKYADTYELVVPEALVESAAVISYRSGKIHALRPAFRVLGPVASFVYEALEQGHQSTPAIMRATNLSRSAVQDALYVLDGHALATKAGETWMVLSPNMDFLAEMLGATTEVEFQRQAYAQQRFLWVAWLNSRLGFFEGFEYTEEDYPFEQFEPPLEAKPPPI